MTTDLMTALYTWMRMRLKETLDYDPEERYCRKCGWHGIQDELGNYYWVDDGCTSRKLWSNYNCPICGSSEVLDG